MTMCESETRDAALRDEGPFYAMVRYWKLSAEDAATLGKAVSIVFKYTPCLWFGSVSSGAGDGAERGIMAMYFRSQRPEGEWRELLQLELEPECIEEMRFVSADDSGWESRRADEALIAKFGGATFGVADDLGPRPHLRQAEVSATM
jgi:hypothetical protein